MENSREKGKALIASYIAQSAEGKGFSSEDIVGIFSPILIHLERLHDQEKVVFHRGLDAFECNEHGRLTISDSIAKDATIDLSKVNKILPKEESSFDIISEQHLTTDLRTSETDIKDISSAEVIPENILAPMFLPAYKSYETVLGHHDSMTDLHVLGMIMASVALSINLEEKQGVKTLSGIVKNPAFATKMIHPNVLRVILDMLELDRRKRIRDAYSVRIRLENYLEYSSTNQEDFDQVLDQYSEKEGNRNKWILSKLRNRLFDLSKRNRLIYFKKSSRYVNLTLSSVPYVMDYKNIRPEKLFIWNEEIATHLKKGTSIKLSKYLKTQENRQIATSLKKVYYEGNRDKAEFGFNQLKLAFCFLNWYNYKENENVKIQSPLLLIPANLKKKKGINDDFTLELLETEAQVNPVLAYYLKELFDIRLPKTVDLSTTSIEEIYETVNKAIIAKSNSVKLEMVQKPRLRLIHSLAKRSFEAYKKKVRGAVTRSIWGSNGDYSYDSTDYRPLGLKLYKERIRSQSSFLEFLIDPKVRLEQNAVEINAKKELFQIESDGNIDPHKWEFDLCNFTLGNFNYQRMTLVNDYDSLMMEKLENDVFDSLFSTDPKQAFLETTDKTDLGDNYCVIPADPTQLLSIKKAKEGRSYIIQGPPGTGKSQTIANLLANKVAEGKTVLFISEKRAALDVVYARMSQMRLKDVCTLIHDSQADKKAFIFDLKDTYEKYTEEENVLLKSTEIRNEIITQLNEWISILEKFHNFQKRESEGVQVRQVIDVLLYKGFDKNAIDPRFYPKAPNYIAWKESKETILQIRKAIANSTKYKELSSCPFLSMDERIGHGSSTAFLLEKCDVLEKQLEYITTAVRNAITDEVNDFATVEKVVIATQNIGALHAKSLLSVLEPSSSKAIEYQNALTSIAELKIALAKAEEKTKNWKKQPDIHELKRLYKQYQEVNSGFFNKLLGKKGQFVDKLADFYNFEAHIVPPEPEELFADMQAVLITKEKLENFTNENPILSAIEGIDIQKAKQDLAFLIEVNGNPNLINDTIFINFLPQSSDLRTRMQEVVEAKNVIAPLENRVDNLFDLVDDMRINAPALFSLAPRLKEWFALPIKMRTFILDSKLSIDEIEYAAAYKYLLLTDSEEGAELTGSEITRIVDKIGELYPKLLDANSDFIVNRVKKNFQDALDLSFIPSYELTETQRTKKNRYHEGRAVLENEFNKKIRYKSIRELAGGDTGCVVKDLKPIWMMSPLSVSDTLPLESMFDIVIFDEASQITVEEGIPPLYRANQAIIVGDEMQMPPSDFFSTKVDESEEDAEYLSMDAESLLNQGARKLPQVTLGWHYRSKKEALINFSNFAFYRGSLMSIPDVNNPLIEEQAIDVFEREDAVENIKKLLDNSITYHYLPNGVYQNRSNEEEAAYIAQMVRELLVGPNEKSIGIVAFSMQQQSIIETALSTLADQDKTFAIALEDAYSGSDDEEFTGLFVKNLENVQGDERDIMILSICYGYNPKGRMLMNFGPINRRGGEKRLNVIFSRAKEHIAVVASIKNTDITNESNEGANYLKKYLRYAELISLGQKEAAMSILKSLNRRGTQEEEDASPILTEQIATALQKEGYFIDTNLGQSRLKIDLGIKKTKDQEKYDLGILIDPITDYKSDDYLNLYYNKPTILNVFGWKTYKVFANDWLKNKSLVMRAIVEAIESKEEPAPKPQETVVPDTQTKTIDTLSVSLVHEAKNKFWTISLQGKKVTIEMGDIGQPPVTNTQHFDDENAAKKYTEDQLTSRKGRGFEQKG